MFKVEKKTIVLDSKTTLKKYLKVFLNEFLIKKVLMMTKKLYLYDRYFLSIRNFII